MNGDGTKVCWFGLFSLINVGVLFTVMGVSHVCNKSKCFSCTRHVNDDKRKLDFTEDTDGDRVFPFFPLKFG